MDVFMGRWMDGWMYLYIRIYALLTESTYSEPQKSVIFEIQLCPINQNL